jgi:hypothetical protein
MDMEISLAADDRYLDRRQHRYQCRTALLRQREIGKKKCCKAQMD